MVRGGGGGLKEIGGTFIYSTFEHTSYNKERRSKKSLKPYNASES